MTGTGQGPQVTILMGLYNGARHLGEQVESFFAQCHGHWTLVASDDGSSDGSAALLCRFFACEPERLRLIEGPRLGFAANYLHLLASLPDQPGWVALSDQDDVWLPDRLARGLEALSAVPGPALHCGRSWVSSEDLSQRRLSRGCPRPMGFRHALVQNVAAGNTLLLNPEAASALVRLARVTERVVAHDWWIYQIVTGIGGAAIFDERPLLLYRQHGVNSFGANNGLGPKLARLRELTRGRMAEWNRINLAALSQARGDLTGENRALLDAFHAMRADHSALARLRRLRAMGLYRQTRSSTLALWLAALMGWL